MDTEVFAPVTMLAVSPLLLVTESALTLYGRPLTLTVTFPSGPVQPVKLRLEEVPTFTGGVFLV